MEVSSSSSLATSTSLSAMASPNSHFLKLEDLSASSPSAASMDDFAQSSTPSAVVVYSKPAKKRKSWGQQLPEPTTNLPPRKRAKTEDEKEQRRIERIKRNRAAAHNSRERKRQETNVLAVQLAHAQAKLDAYERLHGPLPASIQLPEVIVVPEESPAPSQPIKERRTSVNPPPSLPEAADSLFDGDDDDDIEIKEEPDLTFPTLSTTAPTFDLTSLTTKPSPAPSLLDPTQHSAVMLCDLPCRSRQRSSKPSSALPGSQSINTWWTVLFLHLMTLSLQTTYKTLLLAIWSHSPSRMARMMQASAARSSPSTITSTQTRPLLLSHSMVALAQLNAATRRTVMAQQQRLAVVDGTSRHEEAQTAAMQQHSHHTRDEALEDHAREGRQKLGDDTQGVGR